MYVVGVGLVKVYMALIRLARGALSVPLLMCISDAFFILVRCNKIFCSQKL